LKSIDCCKNRLKSLPELPKNLKTLDCADNQLTYLPDLPDSVEYLDCADNQLTSLPNLPDDLETILVSGNNIMFTSEQISILSKIKIDINITELIIESRIYEWAKGHRSEMLDLSGLELTVLPQLPNNIRKLNLNNNKLTELDLFSYDQLTYLFCSENQLTRLDVSECNKLLELTCDDNRLNHLVLNKSLVGLSACRNQLTNSGLVNILECEELDYINLIGNKLTEMIQHYNVIKINLSDNLLTSVKLVSPHPFEFTSIVLHDNKISNLEIVGLVNLEHLHACNNKIETIKLENLPVLSWLKLNNNLISENSFENGISIPVSVKNFEIDNNMLTELPQLNNIQYLSCNSNRIEKINILASYPLITLELSDNDIRVVSGLDKLKFLHSLDLDNNFLTEFPSINYNLKNLNLDNNNIAVFRNLKTSGNDPNGSDSRGISEPYQLQDISINNNLIRHITGDMLPDTLTSLSYIDNIIDKCVDLDPRIEVDCNLYDNYLDVKNDDYQQTVNTFLDVSIVNDTHTNELEYEWKRDERSDPEWKRDERSETERSDTERSDSERRDNKRSESKSKRTRTNNVECANITTILGDDVNNSNTDILILNPVNDKYIIYCYNYTEYFDALKANKTYEWDVKSNSGNPNVIYYKEPYIGIFIDRKGYELSKIYNTFIVEKIGVKRVGTISDNWVSRIHGQEYDIYTLIPIKQRDLVSSITEKRKLRDNELVLREVELADLNTHFRSRGIQQGIGVKYVDYNSENLNIHVYWSKSMRSEEINYFVNKRTKIKYTTQFVNRRLF
jgi:Leucine-rich repeat (LRR) protein